MPRRASHHRALPIRPVLLQIRAMRPRFARIEAPRVHLIAIIRDDPCSKPGSAGTPPWCHIGTNVDYLHPQVATNVN